VRIILVLVVLLGASCALHVHLEVGVRHDGNATAVHGGVALAIGGDNSRSVDAYYGGTFGGGIDIDQEYGLTGTVNAAYIGAGPGPLMHGARFTALGKTAVKLGGGLAVPFWQNERKAACALCGLMPGYEDPEHRTTDFGTLGVYVSAMADTNGPSIAGDLVLDLMQ
jgi:hypothetical protein